MGWMSLCTAKKAHLGITQMSLFQKEDPVYPTFKSYKLLFLAAITRGIAQAFFDELPIKTEYER